MPSIKVDTLWFWTFTAPSGLGAFQVARTSVDELQGDSSGVVRVITDDAGEGQDGAMGWYNIFGLPNPFVGVPNTTGQFRSVFQYKGYPFGLLCLTQDFPSTDILDDTCYMAAVLADANTVEIRKGTPSDFAGGTLIANGTLGGALSMDQVIALQLEWTVTGDSVLLSLCYCAGPITIPLTDVTDYASMTFVSVASDTDSTGALTTGTSVGYVWPLFGVAGPIAIDTIINRFDMSQCLIP